MSNMLKITDKLPANYDSMTPDQQYQARLALMKTAETNNNIYHTEKVFLGSLIPSRQDRLRETVWT